MAKRTALAQTEIGVGAPRGYATAFVKAINALIQTK